MVLGKDGKVVFIKYGNFIRRVPLDRIVPAQEYVDDDENTDDDQDDVKKHERMQDNSFDNVEIVAKKDIEIENLKTINSEHLKRIEQLETNVDPSNLVESRDGEQCNQSL